MRCGCGWVSPYRNSDGVSRRLSSPLRSSSTTFPCTSKVTRRQSLRSVLLSGSTAQLMTSSSLPTHGLITVIRSSGAPTTDMVVGEMAKGSSLEDQCCTVYEYFLSAKAFERRTNEQVTLSHAQRRAISSFVNSDRAQRNESSIFPELLLQGARSVVRVTAGGTRLHPRTAGPGGGGGAHRRSCSPSAVLRRRRAQACVFTYHAILETASSGGRTHRGGDVRPGQ